MYLSVTVVPAVAAIEASDPDQLLLLAVFSVCALAAVFMAAVSWLPG